MPRYEGMEDLLRRVRERLVDEPAAMETGTAAHAYPMDRTYEQVLTCMQGLMRQAEVLRNTLSAEQIHALSPKQQEHILLELNAVMQELWSSEVLLRRAGLNE